MCTGSKQGRRTVRPKATNCALLNSDHDWMLLRQLGNEGGVQGLAEPILRSHALCC